MKNLRGCFTLLTLLFLVSCGNSISDTYRLDKRYWNVDDYEHVVRQIRYVDKSERKASYGDVEKAIVFKKFIDRENIDVVLLDDQLGISHRSEFASEIFDSYRDLVPVYTVMDREDHYIYPEELVDLLNFGLYLQLHYFKAGNDEIIKNADDPESRSTKRIINQNVQTLIGNYNNYLGYIKNESSFDDVSLEKYAEGILDNFSELIGAYPKAKYGGMIKKIDDMANKSNSEQVISALSEIRSQIADLKE